MIVHGVGAPEAGITSGGFAAAMVNTMRKRGAPAPMFERYTFHLPLNGVAAPPKEDGALPAEDVLLRRQLDDYAGAEPNETMVVPAFAIRPGGEKMPPIDVYGAWWGDIGSFGEGPIRSALYVLRFISRFFSLGLTSVEAAADTTGTRFWYQTEWWHKTFARLVFGVIPTVLLLNVLAVVAIAARGVSMDTALRVSLVVATIVVVAAMLPRILRSGNSGPMDWFARPGVYAIIVLLLIGFVDANREYWPGMPLYRWITPLHLLGVIWLLTGVAVVMLARNFVSIGEPAPRWPRTAEPVPPADALAARRTPRAKFVDLTWLTTVALAIPVPFGDVGSQVSAAFSVTFFVTMFGAPFRLWSVFGWWRQRAARAQLREYLFGNWSRRAGVALAAIIVLAVLGRTTTWLLYATVATAVIVTDIVAFYRDRPFRQHALPGIGGALVIFGPALVLGQLAELPGTPSSTVGAVAALLSLTLLELFSRLDAWWSQPQESPAFAQASTRGRMRRARLWATQNHAALIVGVAAIYAAWTFAATATTTPAVVEFTQGSTATLLSETADFVSHGEWVLKQSVVSAFGQLQVALTTVLTYAWGAALLIVFLALVVAMYVTVRGVGRWGERRYLATTSWTSVVTASGTLVSVLLVQSLVIQIAIGEVADRDTLPQQVSAAESPAAVPAAVPAAGLSIRERFWKQVDSPALHAENEVVMRTLGLIHDWAGVQLLALVVFALILGGAAAWTLIPAIRTDTNPQAQPWGDPVQLGRWATTGWEVLRIIIAIGFPLLALAPIALAIFVPEIDETAHTVNAWLYTFMFGAGGVVALSQLGAIMTVLRPALALAADIEIYLRVAPYDRTPRARLLDRITSLLTHLETSGYERIVVVAHSQGTVVAADALRLRGRHNAQKAKAEGPPAKPAPRVSLITMGSPLQNLYASAFPYLYSWVQDTDADVDDGSVNAKRAGVAQWINLYKSGDYIGRHLWFSGTDAERYADQSATVGERSGKGISFDTCIGYGGHTGYWSHPAVLDAVLAQAAMAPQSAR